MPPRTIWHGTEINAAEKVANSTRNNVRFPAACRGDTGTHDD